MSATPASAVPRRESEGGLRPHGVVEASDVLTHRVRGEVLADEAHSVVRVAAADAYDVVQTVRLARQHGLRVAVTDGAAGGHAHGPGLLAGVLLLDLSALDEVAVRRGRVRFGAGVRTGAPGTEHLGLPAGQRVATSRHPAVVALDAVTGAGRLVRTSAYEQVDLYAALRDAPDCVAVVTAAEIALPLPPGPQPLPPDAAGLADLLATTDPQRVLLAADRLAGRAAEHRPRLGDDRSAHTSPPWLAAADTGDTAGAPGSGSRRLPS